MGDTTPHNHEEDPRVQDDPHVDSDSDEEHVEGEENMYFLHDTAEQGALERLQELLPAKNDNGERPHAMHVMAAETCLLEKDDMGCLPVHIAIIYQHMDCTLHMLRYSEALLAAMVRMKCADLNTPFVHLILRVGGNNPQFATDLIREIFGDTIVTSEDLRAVLFEALAAKDDEGNSVFHLCAMFNLCEAMKTLMTFFRAQIEKENDSKDVLSMLLEKGNRLGLRALHTAIKFDSVDVATLLVHDLAVDVNTLTSLKQTPLHIAALVGSTAGAKVLLQSTRKPVDTTRVDAWGSTALAIARRSHFVDLAALLSDTGDDDHDTNGSTPAAASTKFFFHQDSLRHLPMAYHRRGGNEPPPENPERIDTLVDPVVGILRSREFQKPHIVWHHDIDTADMADILRVHEYHYVRKIRERCQGLGLARKSVDDDDSEALYEDDPQEAGNVSELDPDTALSLRSYDAAARAAGAVCRAVDAVVRGECTNAFCIVRPPGHHAGPTGKVTCCNDPDGSHGFCVFNNVAIGAAYARSHFKHEGIHRIAILDFDVHHGNGTEEIIRQLVPSVTELRYETPYGEGKQVVHQYKPWRNEQDADNVFFCSVHGYGHKDPQGEFSAEVRQAWFYPGSGESVEKQSPLIMNVGMSYCPEGASVSRLKWRSSFRDNVLPKLKAFEPDLIFLSAGFDAHKKEQVNWGYVALLEQDYEWLVHHVKQVANECCKGRLISVLEGGYNFHGRMVSPFARSVAAHARALACPSREGWHEEIIAMEAQHERTILDNYLNPPTPVATTMEIKSNKKRNFVPSDDASASIDETTTATTSTATTAVRSKRARKQVDYVALAAELAKEGK